MSQLQPMATRPHIGLFGRRNTGKSSLLNCLLGHELALVSHVAGTTADPVEKSVEIPPLGPVALIDTAGIDDVGELGEQRVQKTVARLSSVHLALLVTDGTWGRHEERMLALFSERNIPFIVVWNKIDLGKPEPALLEKLAERGVTPVFVSSLARTGMPELTSAMLRALPEEALAPPPMLRDLLPKNGVCLFVAPIDGSAPKNRLIAPQVQALRDLLDGHQISLLVQPEEIKSALGILRRPPDLLVADSQAVHECVRASPPELPLTTYSILMARMKGDLSTLAAGAAAIHGLRDGDSVCISEVCAHHAMPDDIGRVKIPLLLKKFTGADLDIQFAAGRAYPADLKKFKLVIHCGGCMINRPVMLARIAEARQAGVPITNYGVAISLLHNVLERSLQIFPEDLKTYKAACAEAGTFRGK